MSSRTADASSNKPADGFSFINVSGDPRSQSNEHTKAVKSHVMRRIRGQTREARTRGRKEDMGRGTSVPYHTTNQAFDTSATTHHAEELVHTARTRGRGKSFGRRKSSAPSGVGQLQPSTRDCQDDEDVPSQRESGVETSSVGASNAYPQSPRTHESQSFEEQVIRRLEKSTKVNRRQLVSPAAMDANLNPYHVMPITVTPRIIMLLHGELTNTIRTSVHADPSGRYFSYYIDDPARLYSTLAYSAILRDKVTGENIGDGPIYFAKALKTINENLADPTKRSTDTMITTVTVFSNIENLNGDPAKSVIHLNAVQRMVELRGGFENLGMHGLLRRMVLWCDLLLAARTQVAPRFPLQPLEPQESITEFIPPAIANSTTLEHGETLLSEAMFFDRREILEILERLHELTVFLNVMPSGPGYEFPQQVNYADRVYIVEHMIATALSREPQHESFGGGPDSIFHTILHACQLYVYTNLRQTPVGGTLRKALVTRLKAHLEQLNMMEMISRYPAEMLWILLLGLMTALDLPKELFWFESFDTICKTEGLNTWDDIRHAVGGLPVLEMVYQRRCEEWWDSRAYANTIEEL